MPLGSESTREKLMELLRQTEKELWAEETKPRRRRHLIWDLRKRMRYIDNKLHRLLREPIFKRDGYKCKACDSTAHLELVRIFTLDTIWSYEKVGKRKVGKFPPAEMRYAEENLFTLCDECHRRFDSFSGRIWRSHLKISSVDSAVELLRSRGKAELWHSGKPLVFPPPQQKYSDYMRCRPIRTLFKVLRKASIFHRQNDPRKVRLYLGLVKREWSYISRRKTLPPNVCERIEGLLKICCLGQDLDVEKLENKIRQSIMEHLEMSMLPDVFWEFKEDLSKQDEALQSESD